MSVGESVRRVDGGEKATGQARYVDDLRFPGMAHAVLLTAPGPHGKLLGLNLESARASEGVLAILTAEDVQGENQVGCVFPDQPLLVADRYRFVGDRLAIVVGTSRKLALQAAARIDVEHEALPVVTDPERALEPGAAKIHPEGNLIVHQRVRKESQPGALEASYDKAELIIEGSWQAPYQEHAYLEPNGVVAVPGDGDTMTLWASMQCPWYVQGAVARALGVPLAAVRAVQTTTGGAFGGKEDYPNEPGACAAVAARFLGCPVKLVYDRHEDIVRSTKRHRIRTDLKVAATKDGELLSVKATLYVDAGAYAGLSTVVSERANISAVGPYRVANASVDTLVVRTNNLFGGAYRGFGHPQVAFAFESMMDELAARVGVTPGEIRRRNVVDREDMALSGQPLAGSGPTREVLETALAKSAFEARRAEFKTWNEGQRWRKRGVGIGFIQYGVGLHAGGQHLEGSGALVQVMKDGSAQVAIGGTEIGQGAYTMAAQIASSLLGIPTSRFRATATDTSILPDSGPTVASRTTVMSGNAVKDAASRIRARLLPIAAELLDAPVEGIETGDGVYRDTVSGREIATPEVTGLAWRRKLKMTESGWYAPPPKPWDIKTGQGVAYLVYASAAHIAEVEVDLISGETQVLKVTAVHDVGRAINPEQVRGQIFGGVSHGLGYALMEDLQLKDGVPLNANFTDYLIPSVHDMPPVDIILMEEPFEDGPFGAKGIGEPSLIPAPAAIANAVSDAVNHPFHEMPITPERVLQATSKYM